MLASTCCIAVRDTIPPQSHQQASGQLGTGKRRGEGGREGGEEETKAKKLLRELLGKNANDYDLRARSGGETGIYFVETGQAEDLSGDYLQDERNESAANHGLWCAEDRGAGGRVLAKKLTAKVMRHTHAAGFFQKKASGMKWR